MQLKWKTCKKTSNGEVAVHQFPSPISYQERGSRIFFGTQLDGPWIRNEWEFQCWEDVLPSGNDEHSY